MDTRYPPEFYAWEPVTKLAAEEGASRHEIYWAIERGLKHSRVGRRIRVRRADWHDWHAAHAQGGGK